MKDELRTLIVAPASLVYNWKKEVERFTPQLSVCVMAGTAHERKELIKNQTSNVDVWITSYDLLKRDIELYQDIIFANEILMRHSILRIRQHTQQNQCVL